MSATFYVVRNNMEDDGSDISPDNNVDICFIVDGNFVGFLEIVEKFFQLYRLI